MKILYIITKSNWGGAQKYVYDLATNLNSENDITVAFGGYGILAEKLKENDVKGIHINNLDRDVNILKELKVFLSLYKLYKNEKPDIVHLNSSKIGALGSFIGRLASIKKIIFTAHGFPFREERPFWQVSIIKFISWLSIIFSHITICVSKKDFDDVKNWPFVKNKIIIIHNGIEIENKENNNCDTGGEVKIVSIGELHKNKGFEYGLLAINILKEKVQNFKYTILTFGGDEKEKLEKMILDLNLNKYVNLFISNQNHNQLLKDFDIYFMPSIKEGLPYVLLEAGINSLPIVSSNTGGISEIIENYKNGILVKAKDINGFEEALFKLILDKDLRIILGQEGKMRIQENFNLEKMIKETKESYFS